MSDVQPNIEKKKVGRPSMSPEQKEERNKLRKEYLKNYLKTYTAENKEKIAEYSTRKYIGKDNVQIINLLKQAHTDGNLRFNEEGNLILCNAEISEEIIKRIK